jgi:hypothetical protein
MRLLSMSAQSSAGEDGDIRLSYGGFNNETGAAFGRLEVYVGGGWGTVCEGSSFDGTEFTQVSAGVACKQLGYAAGFFSRQEIPISNADRQSLELVPILFVGVSCAGSESRLVDCPRSDLDLEASRSCDHLTDVDLICYAGDDPGATIYQFINHILLSFWTQCFTLVAREALSKALY